MKIMSKRLSDGIVRLVFTKRRRRVVYVHGAILYMGIMSRENFYIILYLSKKAPGLVF